MRWYFISKTAALSTQTVDDLASRYEAIEGIDPRMSAQAVLSLQKLVEWGLRGDWTYDTIGQVMGVLDRVNIGYEPPPVQDPARDQAEMEAEIDAMMDPSYKSPTQPPQMPPQQDAQPQQPMPAQPEQPQKPRERSRWRRRLYGP